LSKAASLANLSDAKDAMSKARSDGGVLGKPPMGPSGQSMVRARRCARRRQLHTQHCCAARLCALFGV
jgi:hypothetical protein